MPDYPESAVREALANALIHRDYQRLGAVHLQWHDDRIEVLNPGGFPEGVRLDNLLVTGPRPRNPLLADAFNAELEHVNSRCSADGGAASQSPNTIR